MQMSSCIPSRDSMPIVRLLSATISFVFIAPGNNRSDKHSLTGAHVSHLQFWLRCARPQGFFKPLPTRLLRVFSILGSIRPNFVFEERR